MSKLKIVAALACSFALCLVLAGCSGGSAADDAAGDATDAAATAADTASTAVDNAGEAAGAATSAAASAGGEFDLTGVDFTKVDATIEFGDFDGMQTLSKSIQNLECDNQVVQIDGLVSHPGSTYSIVEANADGSNKVGTAFQIVGADSSAYPAEGTRVKITGVVLPVSDFARNIITLPQYVEVVE